MSGSVLSAFLSSLQNASFRGLPFLVNATAVKTGRKLAVHEYPFRDGGWPEDMGRALRMYSFTGFLVGDLGPAMQLALDNAVETPGPGMLIHPTVGAVMVAVLSYSSSIRKDAMRVIEVSFEFIEAGTPNLTATLIATAVATLAAADVGVTAGGNDLGSAAGAAAAAGSAPAIEGVSVVTAFGATCTVAGADPTGIVSMATGLPPPSSSVTYGRYANGNASTVLPAGTTIATLEAQITAQQATLASAIAAATAAAASFNTTTATALAALIAAVTEAVRATMTDPADQVRVLLGLCDFSYTDSAGGIGISGDIATVRNAMSAACRLMAAISLARASAAYQPISYQDAQTVLHEVKDALGRAITAAGDAEQDATYTALCSLQAAVVRDLTTRGSTLPQVITATFAMPLPTLVVAQILYQNAAEADQIAAEVDMPHPAFSPLSMQVLAASASSAASAATTAALS